MGFLRLAAVLVSAVFLAGCEYDRFEIEIRPDGDGFERSLTGFHVGGGGENAEFRPLDESELKRIGAFYEKREAIENGTKHVFTGRFTDRTPGDVGGAGSYTHLACPLGTLSAYVERFRGTDDLQSQLDSQRKAADRFVDLVIGWLESELGDEPNFDRLKEFLGKEFRQDVHNLILYAWTFDAATAGQEDEDMEAMGAQFLVRAGHYLYERSYFAMEDFPELARAANSLDSGPLTKHVQHLIARKMGVADDAPVPKSLAFLTDSQTVEVSWDNYIRATDSFKHRVEQWQEAKKTDPEAEEPTPGQLVEELCGGMLPGFGLSGGVADKLQVTFHCDEEPMATNGEWQEDDKVVTWETDLRKQPALPVLAFASWTCPERKTQEKHFGRVLLTRDDLAQYVLWYGGLSEDEARQWDRLIDGCRPGEDLESSIGAFRFDGDPKPDPSKPDEEPKSLADGPRQLILGGLSREEKDE